MSVLINSKFYIEPALEFFRSDGLANELVSRSLSGIKVLGDFCVSVSRSGFRSVRKSSKLNPKSSYSSKFLYRMSMEMLSTRETSSEVQEY